MVKSEKQPELRIPCCCAASNTWHCVHQWIR